MRTISLEELLEAGCHFGHQVVRSNPKARDYIYEARDGIHIIDLAKTKEGLEEAGKYVKKVAQTPNSTLVIVGTKRQSSDIIKNSAEKAKKEVKEDPGIYFVTSRWVGGLLTNFAEVSKNFKKMEELNENLSDPQKQKGYTKREVRMWQKEKDKLEKLYGGVYALNKKPDLLFIIDSRLEDIAVKEAIRTGVPTVAITDTNADPTLIDYPIPANDDAAGSLELIIGYIMDAWIEGKNSLKLKVKSEKLEETKTDNSKKPKVNSKIKATDKPKSNSKNKD